MIKADDPNYDPWGEDDAVPATCDCGGICSRCCDDETWEEGSDMGDWDDDDA